MDDTGSSNLSGQVKRIGLGLEGVLLPSSSLLPTISGGIGPPRSGDNRSGHAAPPLLDSHSSSSSSPLSLAAQPAQAMGLGLEGVLPPLLSPLPATSGSIDLGRGRGDSESRFCRSSPIKWKSTFVLSPIVPCCTATFVKSTILETGVIW
ncbi:hypothetical protein GYMLUDRAFT_250496 [Collybiopsis luxurians FD-317 M1]|uniref:Uncharacterized protein n=1 Tax=Collybiopsis luxurians FD-317 M1 TaxID=944289 RepID=A0A0D0BUG8_9AGAR|nr:hypothetical protein GYMLUDRAFT_250496 [Collybiopsis luxurians FD-317 M1]